MMNPYIPQMNQAQDIGGLSPVFQNIAQQQAMQQAAMQQGLNLTNQAGMTVDGKQAGAGYGQIAMANALRKQDPNKQDPRKPAPVTDYSQPMPDAPAYADPAYQYAMY